MIDEGQLLLKVVDVAEVDGMPAQLVVTRGTVFRVYVQAIMGCEQAVRDMAACSLLDSQPKAGETLDDVKGQRSDLAAMLTKILASMPEAGEPT